LSISRGTVRQVALNASEEAAKQALRTIVQAQALYFAGKRARGEPPAFAKSFDELEQAGILPKGTGGDLEGRTGYSFRFSDALLTYSVVATPKKSGDRAFFCDESGVIQFDTGINNCIEAPPPIGG
jgi:hypothetical protein